MKTKLTKINAMKTNEVQFKLLGKEVYNPAGYWYPLYRILYRIGIHTGVWLVSQGCSVKFNVKVWNYGSNGRNCGCSSH